MVASVALPNIHCRIRLFYTSLHLADTFFLSLFLLAFNTHFIFLSRDCFFFCSFAFSLHGNYSFFHSVLIFDVFSLIMAPFRFILTISSLFALDVISSLVFSLSSGSFHNFPSVQGLRWFILPKIDMIPVYLVTDAIFTIMLKIANASHIQRFFF